ncbi:MAG TPA: nucleotidyl transferase AbiEii/AbiGii toxin family protein [Candidatus Pacearchaeota archaeon]|nr:nucleotidyl transferase AbiEii/AbiGii toxin family protein [Candidatus Pacearchaeota archaeon]
MESASEKLLNFGILPPQTKKAFDFLSSQNWLNDSGWYLAGGTALALQADHRKSFDLDFFSIERKFDTKKVLEKFSNNQDWRTSFDEENTVYGELYGAKVSFIAYSLFVPDAEFIKCGAINILSARDIAVMKIIAISQRGRKRDFFDLYWCAKNIEPLEETIKRLKKQYPSVAHDYHHILKSLVYFADAEDDPDPEINFQADWDLVKRYFIKEMPRIMRNIMQLK